MNFELTQCVILFNAPYCTKELFLPSNLIYDCNFCITETNKDKYNHCENVSNCGHIFCITRLDKAQVFMSFTIKSKCIYHCEQMPVVDLQDILYI